MKQIILFIAFLVVVSKSFSSIPKEAGPNMMTQTQAYIGLSLTQRFINLMKVHLNETERVLRERQMSQIDKKTEKKYIESALRQLNTMIYKVDKHIREMELKSDGVLTETITSTVTALETLRNLRLRFREIRSNYQDKKISQIANT